MRESQFIEHIRKMNLVPLDQQTVVKTGIGDDAAVLQLKPADSNIVICKDIITENVDFRVAEVSPFEVGRKAMAVNLSDMAAMAAMPVAALIGLVLPHSTDQKHMPIDYRDDLCAKNIMAGAQACAAYYNVAIVGGDTNSWKPIEQQGTPSQQRENLAPIVVSVTLLGTAWPGVTPLYRDQAKVGDYILVTGVLGGSIQGRHLHFTPRIHEARILASRYQLSSMMDISDGVAKDIVTLATASGVGCRIDINNLPFSAALSGHQNAHRAALQDGEDFELLFTCSKETASQILNDQPLSPLPITCIGSITAASSLPRFDFGSLQQAMGFEHSV